MKSITWNHHERDRENCFADQLLLLFLHVEFNRLIPGNFSLSLFYLDRYELTAFLQEHRVTLSTTFSYVTHSYLQGFENLCYYSTTRSSIDRQHYCFLQRVNDRYEIFLIIRKFRFSINTVRRFKFRRAKNWIRIEKKKRYREKMMVRIHMNWRCEFNGRYFRFNYHVLGVHYKAAGDWNHFDADTKTIQSSSCPRNRNVNACAMGKFRVEARRIHGREFKETTVSHFRVIRGPR